MKLHGSLTSPFVRKVRVLLAEKDIPYEFVTADAWAADTHIPALNPLGKVPVLELDDGDVLFDSPVICEYLDALKTPALIPSAGDARLAVQRWHALANGVLDAASGRLIELRRPAEKQWTDNVVRQEGKIARALDYAERAQPDRDYLVGDRFSLADVALGVALDYIDLRHPHAWRDTHPRLARWHGKIVVRPAFVATEPPGLTRPAAPAPGRGRPA